MSVLVSIDRHALAAVHGGYDLQRTLNAGSAGADHGSFVGRGIGADAAAALLPRGAGSTAASAFPGASIGHGAAGTARAVDAYRSGDFRTGNRSRAPAISAA